jgi:hypothetical protein
MEYITSVTGGYGKYFASKGVMVKDDVIQIAGGISLGSAKVPDGGGKA